MIAILTSSLGGSKKVEGKRVPTNLLNENGLTNQIKKYWKKDAKVIIISASPEETELNDSILYCQKEAFALSGLHASSFEICDARNEQIAERLEGYDVVLLAGGHVPTQNEFLKTIELEKKLLDFTGLLIAWSAGSMNSAKIVYAQPELEGEASSKEYQRFLTGVGITKHMIIPHFQDLKTEIVDGLRVIEDITYLDSMGREFIALNDGSFIISGHGIETLYGEAYLIKDGKQRKICRKNEAVQV